MIPLSQLVAIAVVILGTLATLALLIKNSRGRPLLWGTLGSLMILMGVVSRFAFQWTVEHFLGKVDDTSIVTILAAEIAAGGVLVGVGLLLLTRAMVLAGRLRPLQDVRRIGSRQAADPADHRPAEPDPRRPRRGR